MGAVEATPERGKQSSGGCCSPILRCKEWRQDPEAPQKGVFLPLKDLTRSLCALFPGTRIGNLSRIERSARNCSQAASSRRFSQHHREEGIRRSGLRHVLSTAHRLSLTV